MKFLYSVILFCQLAPAIMAQQTQANQQAEKKTPQQWFDDAVRMEFPPLVNGIEYRLPFKGFNSHPFFVEAAANVARLEYDGDLYDKVYLVYDCFDDELVLKHKTPVGDIFVQMDSKKVQYFDLHNHHFKKIEAGRALKLGVYFDVLFEQGEFAIVSKRAKIQRITGGITDYLDDDTYYLYEDGSFRKLTGNSSLERYFADKKLRLQLQSFLETNHINLKNHRDAEYAKVGAFCYSLKRTP